MPSLDTIAKHGTKLKNPLVFIDLETTGVDIVKDRIVEMALLGLKPNGQSEVKVHRVNPTVPIPAESTAIHGITDEDVKDKPTFQEIMPSVGKHDGRLRLGGVQLEQI